MPVITIFGGSGFIGRYAARKLAKRGWRVRVAVRRPNDALFLKTAGAVGQIDVMQANIRDEASTARALHGADAVLNLVGILFETGRQKFGAVQLEGAERVARLAAEAGVKHFVHMSAIGADAESSISYKRTKGEAEQAVRAHMPQATILRPSVVFGPEDGFFNMFAGMARLSPVLPLIGGDTKFQPVYVDDVAEAAVRAVETPEAAGQTYELGGPRVATMREMLTLMNQIIRRRRLLAPTPFWAAKIKGWFLQQLPKPMLTVDQVRMLESDNIVTGADGSTDGFAALGIAPQSMEAILPTYLYQYRPYGQYAAIRDDAKARDAQHAAN